MHQTQKTSPRVAQPIHASGTLIILAALLSVWGCHGRSAVPPVGDSVGEPTSTSAVDELRQAVESQQWDVAKRLSRSALIQQDQDPVVLDLAASAAFHTGDRQLASELLLKAYHADQPASPQRISRTLTGLMSVGRYFETLEVLRGEVRRSPDNHEFRRLLLESLLGVETHDEATAHIQALIRGRAFTVETLLSFEAPHERTLETETLETMVRLHPSDLRPLIAVAKKEIDRGDYRAARQTLARVISRHPQDARSRALLGRVLVYLEDFHGLRAWATGHQAWDELARLPDTWLTLGDWATHHKKTSLAQTAYASAARLSDEIGMHHPIVWAKLASSISSSTHADNQPAEASVVDEFARVQLRADLWMRYRQSVAEFRATGERSPRIAAQISKIAQELGRLWEAEAWAAVLLTKPTTDDQGRELLSRRRQSVLDDLTTRTPWQQPDTVPPKWSRGDIGADVMVAKLIDEEPHRGIDERIDERIGERIGEGMKEGYQEGIERGLTNGQRVAFGTPPTVPVLSDEAERRGMVFFGKTAEDLSRPGVMNHEMMGCGGGTLDYDLDGWPDFYLMSAGGTPVLNDSSPNALFRNLEGRFTEVTLASGGDDRGFGQGVAIGDLNEDGFDDLLVLNYGPNRVYLNNGDGTFSVSIGWLPDESMWSTSGAIADIDSDGISDAVVLNYAAGLGPATERCELNGAFRACSPNHFPAVRDTFLKGLPTGGLQFAMESWRAEPSILGRGLGVVVGQFDQEPGVEILIANDMSPNHFWTRERNQTGATANQTSATANQTGAMGEADAGPFRLTETAMLAGLATDARSQSQGSMGIAAGDVDGDGVVDFYVSNYQDEYNTLHVGDGVNSWRDRTVAHVLAAPTLPMVGFGTQFVDLDNNGEVEIVVANGHVDLFDNVSVQATYAQPPQLFQRDASGRFRSIGSKLNSDYFRRSHVGRALWLCDVDRDGKQDFAVTHQTEPLALLVNATPDDHGFITLHLVGTRDARSAIGSVVRVSPANSLGHSSLGHSSLGPSSLGPNPARHDQVSCQVAGDGFLCGNQRQRHFGLGKGIDRVDVTVTWPDGATESFHGLATRRTWLLIQGQLGWLETGPTSERPAANRR